MFDEASLWCLLMFVLVAAVGVIPLESVAFLSPFEGGVSIASLAFTLSAFGVPLPRFLFEEPADQGSGGSSPQPPSKGEEPSSPSYSNEVDPDVAEAMAMTERLSKPDGSGEPEGDGGRETGDGESSGGDSEGPTSDSDESESVSSEEEDHPPAPPSKGEEDSGESDSEFEYKEGFDPSDTVEVDGEAYFYHADEHGKESGQGTRFKSRDAAESAWGAKVAHIQDQVKKLQELGKDVGPIELPSWMKTPDADGAFDEVMDVDYALSLPNDDLRSHIKEADSMITHLNNRVDRLSNEKQTTELTSELEQETERIHNQIAESANELGLMKDIQSGKFADNDALAAGMKAAVEAKVADDLKADVKAYNDYKKDENARIDDPDYADKLEKMRDDIREKRDRLMTDYSKKHLSVFEQIPELKEKASKLKESQSEEVSEKQRLKKINSAFQGLQTEMKDEHIIFQSSDPKGAQQFYNWAMKRSDEFNLQTEYGWGQALRSFDGYMKNRRAEIRQKKIEQENREKEKANEEIPKYSEKDRFKKDDRKETVYDKNQDEVEELMKETTERLSS